MDTKLLVSNEELLKSASERIKLPKGKSLFVGYDNAVDALFLKYSEKPSVISRSKDTDGIIYDFDENDNLLSIEILDFYGVFV